MMRIAGIQVSGALDAEGDLKWEVDGFHYDPITLWLDADDRAALIEHLQQFPLPPTGQETEND